jgi:hypothetical protein
MPSYLSTSHPFDDIPYLFSKEILLERIPYMLARSLFDDYDVGKSYKWAEGKTFSAEVAMRAYQPPDNITPMFEETYFADNLVPNLAAVEEMILNHAETEFFVFFSPYSLIWWDDAYRNGLSDAYLYVLEQAIPALIEYPNVTMFYFQNNRDIVLNADNYMDKIHYSEAINYLMYEHMVSGQSVITVDNYKSVLEDMRRLVEEIAGEYIFNYYDFG